jgi:hypothetical protein
MKCALANKVQDLKVFFDRPNAFRDLQQAQGLEQPQMSLQAGRVGSFPQNTRYCKWLWLRCCALLIAKVKESWNSESACGVRLCEIVESAP